MSLVFIALAQRISGLEHLRPDGAGNDDDQVQWQFFVFFFLRLLLHLPSYLSLLFFWWPIVEHILIHTTILHAYRLFCGRHTHNHASTNVTMFWYSNALLAGAKCGMWPLLQQHRLCAHFFIALSLSPESRTNRLPLSPGTPKRASNTRT